VVNRAQLIDDSLNLARAEIIDYSIPLQILKYLRMEIDYVPWAAADRGLGYIDKIIHDADYYPHFLNFMRENVNLTFANFGVVIGKDDTNFDKHVRNLGIKWACKTGIEGCLTGTAKLVESDEEIHVDLKSSVYCNGFKNSTTTVYNSYLKKLEVSQNAQERSLLISTLGCSENEEFLKSFLKNTIDGLYKPQESSSIFSSVIQGSSTGLNLMLEFLVENSNKINSTYDHFDNRGGLPKS
jgi:aminopeptidase N